jgi:hypothetical protein
MGLSERVSAMRAAPARFDRPSGKRRWLIELLDELSQKDLGLLIQLVIELTQRLKAS